MLSYLHYLLVVSRPPPMCPVITAKQNVPRNTFPKWHYFPKFIQTCLKRIKCEQWKYKMWNEVVKIFKLHCCGAKNVDRFVALWWHYNSVVKWRRRQDMPLLVTLGFFFLVVQGRGTLTTATSLSQLIIKLLLGRLSRIITATWLIKHNNYRTFFLC